MGPMLLWMGLIFVASTDVGRYENSWRLILRVLQFLCPEFATPPAPDGDLQVNVSMYQINTGMRRLAHVLLYAILTFLTVRFIQRGEPRLKMTSLIAALLITAVYAGLEEGVTYLQQHRHAGWSDIKLNLYGIALVLGGTAAFFQIKAWERALQEPLEEPVTSLSEVSSQELRAQREITR